MGRERGGDPLVVARAWTVVARAWTVVARAWTGS